MNFSIQLCVRRPVATEWSGSKPPAILSPSLLRLSPVSFVFHSLTDSKWSFVSSSHRSPPLRFPLSLKLSPFERDTFFEPFLALSNWLPLNFGILIKSTDGRFFGGDIMLNTTTAASSYLLYYAYDFFFISNEKCKKWVTDILFYAWVCVCVCSPCGFNLPNVDLWLSGNKRVNWSVSWIPAGRLGMGGGFA